MRGSLRGGEELENVDAEVVGVVFFIVLGFYYMLFFLLVVRFYRSYLWFCLGGRVSCNFAKIGRVRDV